jgi:hypothetical protein
MYNGLDSSCLFDTHRQLNKQLVLLKIEFDVILYNKLYLRLFGRPALVVVD